MIGGQIEHICKALPDWRRDNATRLPHPEETRQGLLKLHLNEINYKI
jgi:hypothetical protein